MQIVYADFDGTLVKSNSFHYLYFILWRKFREDGEALSLLVFLGCVAAFPLLVFAHLTSSAWRDRLTYRWYRGIEAADLKSLASAFWGTYPDLGHWRTIDFLRQKKQDGCSIIIVSGSIHEVVEAAMQTLGIMSIIDGVMAARLEYRDGLATGRLVGNPMVERHKVEAISAYERGKSIKERTSLSDSYSDRFMLELASRKIVVKPGAKLRKLATQNAWEIWY